MSLLAIPLKVTGDVDLVKPIKTTISTIDTNSLTELQSLRNKMVLNVKNKNHSDSALRDVENYFDQLGECGAEHSDSDGSLQNIFVFQEIWREKYQSIE